MSYSVDVELLCDGPNDVRFDCPANVWAETLPAARRAASRAGWQTSAPGGKDFCPEHRKTTGKAITEGAQA